MEYRGVLNNIALSVLTKAPDIPDFHLMVGTAEELDGLPLVIPQTTIPKKVAENLDNVTTLSNEDIYNSLANNVLEVNDYNGNTAIIAEKIGGSRT